MNLNELNKRYSVSNYNYNIDNELKKIIIEIINKKINYNKILNSELIEIIDKLVVEDFLWKINSTFEHRYIKSEISKNIFNLKIENKEYFVKNLWNYEIYETKYEIPESRTLISCNSCDSRGKYTCNNCKGNKKHSCEECDGKGNIKCYLCSGRGNNKCTHCLGNGCKFCQNGWINCSNCVNGYENCKYCYSNGYVECKYCNGNGFRSCTTCNETGTLIKSKYIISEIYNVEKYIYNSCSPYFFSLNNELEIIEKEKYVFNLKENNYSNFINNIDGNNDYFKNILFPSLDENTKLVKSEICSLLLSYLIVNIKIDKLDLTFAFSKDLKKYVFIDEVKLLDYVHLDLLNKIVDYHAKEDFDNLLSNLSLLPNENNYNIESLVIKDEINDELKINEIHKLLKNKNYLKADSLFNELSLFAKSNKDFVNLKKRFEKINFNFGLSIWMILFTPYSYFYLKCENTFLIKNITIFSILTIIIIASIRIFNKLNFSIVLPIIISTFFFFYQFSDLTKNLTEYERNKIITKKVNKNVTYKDEFVTFYPVDTNLNDWLYANYIDTNENILFYNNFNYNNDINDWEPIGKQHFFKPKSKIYIIKPYNVNEYDRYSLQNYIVASMNANFIISKLPSSILVDSSCLLYKCTYIPVNSNNNKSFTCYIPIKHKIK